MHTGTTVALGISSSRALFNSDAEEKIGYERSDSNVLECISHTSYLAYTLRVVLPSEY